MNKGIHHFSEAIVLSLLWRKNELHCLLVRMIYVILRAPKHENSKELIVYRYRWSIWEVSLPISYREMVHSSRNRVHIFKSTLSSSWLWILAMEGCRVMTYKCSKSPQTWPPPRYITMYDDTKKRSGWYCDCQWMEPKCERVYWKGFLSKWYQTEVKRYSSKLRLAIRR